MTAEKKPVTGRTRDVVIFADADVSGPAPFRFDRIEPGTEASFSTHVMEPATVLGLARDVFGASPAGYLLGVRGYEFDDFGDVFHGKAEPRHRVDDGVDGVGEIAITLI